MVYTRKSGAHRSTGTPPRDAGLAETSTAGREERWFFAGPDDPYAMTDDDDDSENQEQRSPQQ